MQEKPERVIRVPGRPERRCRDAVEKQQCCMAWAVKIFSATLGLKKSRVYPRIEYLVNDDEVAGAKEALQQPASRKEASSWAM
jgi:hypothetical protein